MSEWMAPRTVSATSADVGQMSRRKTWPAVGAHAERIVDQIGVEGSRERVGDDERWRGQVVHADVGVDASLEVPVSRQHGTDREVGPVDRIRYAVEEGTRVADARGAPVSDEVKAERLEWFRQAGLGQVVGDDPGAGREGGLDPRFGASVLARPPSSPAIRRRP